MTETLRSKLKSCRLVSIEEQYQRISGRQRTKIGLMGVSLKHFLTNPLLHLLFLGSPGTGTTHIAIALGLEACQTVTFYTVAILSNLLVEM